MVKFYSSSYQYDYGFPAVSLAYFLRYPNPYSKHVASTDTISRHYDPATQRLTTVRLHQKRSRVPPLVLKLIGRQALGASEDGSTSSLILEKSVVDAKEGWMETESKNLDWDLVLSVVERHRYTSPALQNPTMMEIEQFKSSGIVALQAQDKTNVEVSVTLTSRIGEQIRKRRQAWGEQANAASVAGGEALAETKKPWFGGWGSGAVRSAIENISLQRTEKSQPKARKGMDVVLERLRRGGLVEVLEGMRHDRELDLGPA
ncbi:hypothetical protein K431DRAFT_289607 [Polychaeton citri CBS 116435]|uniref:PRELI/MSF1 domain-containing protein n=1 Tax=Polychaeton citri CBS 116435 TaxID=1314669 RepID=A0A9P4Q0P0_9PEZI|nr:hypothetical protein K431DRAFT_289607 [Polychaeton citri CBS 116435]